MFNSSNPLVHSLTPPLKLSSNLFFISVPKPSNLCTRALKPATANFSLSYSLESPSNQLSLAHSLQSETLEILEWASVCKQLSALAFTAMGFSAAQEAHIPVGRSQEESQKLLDQTTAAVDAITMAGSPPSDFSAIENVSDIVSYAVSGKLLSINELCAMRRTLNAAKGLFEKLKGLALSADCTDRYLPLLEILDDCDFLVELEKTIGLCIDCKLSIIVDTASEDLEIIRSERKSNMENLDSLLKEVSTQIFKAGGIDSPLVTKRRARMCVGVRATHKHLLPGCIVLDVSSSGATYFVEPKEAVELNNMEVRLSNAERAEEIGILSFLTSEIAKSETPIMYLLDKVLEVDLAFARAAYALRMNGVCPIFSSKDCQDLDSGGASLATTVDIEGLQHPLLLEPSLKNLSDVLESSSRNHLSSDDVNGLKMITGSLSGRASDFPVPIDIKIGCGTRVVVISGPNTGGKTASMKALGLASLMSKAGMYLPAKNHPKLPWFDLVLADIGDHQSLEQNLSTFSGHISRICNILEVASKESLVLIDEIGSGTDPSEGVALSASILLYLKGRVNLAVVTTHYADLNRLKEKDNQFENAAMEFCLETLQPTYRILWGSTGDSNALSIAKLIGFNQRIIERAQKWVERLMPEKQQERKGLLYRSLIEERGRLEAQAKLAASLHSDIMDLYREIQDEAEDLDKRKRALMAKETLQVQKEVKTAKSQMESVLNEFDNQLKTAGADQLNLLIRKSEAAIASVIKAHCPDDDLLVSETSTASYTPQPGEQVHLKRLGDKLATVVETPGDDGTVLVQYGKIKVRLKKNDIRAVPSIEKNRMTNSAPRLKQQASQSRTGETESGEVTYGPVIQTSKNTVDLRGMRVEEASDLLDLVISARQSQSVLFVIHGMGTGVVKERALEILKNHPRVAKYEQESPMNYGCTVAYIK
ncbi:PREDICTED: endonuclease MutS2 [Prunus mume]|uniref:Endonuclease MutS2 n=1 Tax=Prunus mume TaxID=102107 RepID=A0ABM0NHZ7_PRUMU|nr:PREDICTED: endonuclease MutS2 [Prunus mume]